MGGRGKKRLMYINHANILGLLKYVFQVWKEAAAEGRGELIHVCAHISTAANVLNLFLFSFCLF